VSLQQRRSKKAWQTGAGDTGNLIDRPVTTSLLMPILAVVDDHGQLYCPMRGTFISTIIAS
jgi:hypothetical protein